MTVMVFIGFASVIVEEVFLILLHFLHSSCAIFCKLPAFAVNTDQSKQLFQCRVHRVVVSVLKLQGIQ